MNAEWHLELRSSKEKETRTCMWRNSSTSWKDKRMQMPTPCIERGCDGVFDRHKPIPERFQDCFIDREDVRK